MTPRQANTLLRMISAYQSDLPPHELTEPEKDAMAALQKISRKRVRQ